MFIDSAQSKISSLFFMFSLLFFFNDTATTEIYTLSLHDALPISVIVAWALAIVGLFALSQFKHEYYALPAFPALALLAGAAWASGRDIGRWLGIGMLGCGAVGVWALWLGAGLTPAPVVRGLAGLNVDYRVPRDQGVPFPFASPRPFSRLLLGLGLTLLVGWSVAALCWVLEGDRKSVV